MTGKVYNPFDFRYSRSFAASENGQAKCPGSSSWEERAALGLYNII